MVLDPVSLLEQLLGHVFLHLNDEVILLQIGTGLRLELEPELEPRVLHVVAVRVLHLAIVGELLEHWVVALVEWEGESCAYPLDYVVCGMSCSLHLHPENV